VSRVGTVRLRGRDLSRWLRAGRRGLLVEMRGGELPQYWSGGCLGGHLWGVLKD